MTIYITYDAVTEALRVLARSDGERSNPVADDGDNNPQCCFYTTPEDEHCIAGQAIINLGGNVPAWGTDENIHFIRTLLEEDEFDIGIVLTNDSVDLLTQCQIRADSGTKWGEIIRSLVPEASI